ncbi:OmcA/MtrC family decaheme c-type cytochrome [Geobacter pickeringii]|uniref:Cytochrome C n=1 Tax=Geobacter pickeringii TaxID=345632 RepID=A0A0B5BC01_9BACT|nr:OmcA/MtrC family decaheme c-type cytochrome [Geobacter pickeringii]AJE04057.1 cytochrome C [Geobacter pickeringii]
MHGNTVRKLLLGVCLLAAATMLHGCGSSKKEGAAVGTAQATPTGNLQASVQSVNTSGLPVVTFTLFDESGNPLDPTSLPANSVRFTIAQLGADGYYKNYIPTAAPTQPGYDSGGTFATVSPGIYTYTFKTDIKDPTKTLGGVAFDPTLTHTVAAQITRTVTSVSGTAFQQAANPYLNFRPDGAAITATREVVSISACNECHGSLGLHGGGRREIALCIVCHYPGVTDPQTGNSVDMKLLIHKIHMGGKLPSVGQGVGYAIIGFGNSFNSYSTVGYPFISGDTRITGTPIECTKCHKQGKDLVGRTFGNDVDKWKGAPKIANCTTCHDTTTFDGSATLSVNNPRLGDAAPNPVTITAAPHSGGITTDAACSGCHPATQGNDQYTLSVIGAHTILEKSPAYFTGINFQILNVTNATAGNAPSVTFKVTKDDGSAITPAAPSSFSLKFGYFTQLDYLNNGLVNYGQPLSQATTAATANGDGSYTIAFATPIPAALTAGVGVIGLEGRIPYTTPKGTFNVGGTAVQWYFNLADGSRIADPSLQRRKVVALEKCNACHTRLSLHGANRVNSIEECVICHNPNATDKTRRVSAPFLDGLAERTVNFKDMIHSIHTGRDLNVKPYVVYGFGNVPNVFSHVRYPNDRRNCIACHLEGTFGLPLPANAVGTTTATGAIANDSSDDTKIRPITAACTSCHDGATTATHISDKVVNGAETCVQCHRTGLLLGPDFAHTPVR